MRKIQGWTVILKAGVVLLVAALLFATIAGCAGGTTTTTATQTTTATVTTSSETTAVEPILVGGSFYMSGGLANIGIGEWRGALIGAEMINEDGGILGRPVKLVARDHTAGVDQAMQGAREMLGMGVKYFMSASRETTAQLFEENKVLSLGPISASRFAGGPYRYTWHVWTTDQPVAWGYADIFMREGPEVHKWATLTPQAYWMEAPIESWVLRMADKDPEFQVVCQQLSNYGQAGGFEPFIRNIMDSSAEGVFFYLTGGDLIAFLRTGVEMGLFDKLKVAVSFHIEWKYVYEMGDQMPEVWMGEVFSDPPFDNELSKRFQEKLVAQWGAEYARDSRDMASMGVEQMYALKAAIERAGSFDVEEIIDKGLPDLVFETPRGTATIRGWGDQSLYSHSTFNHVVPDDNNPNGWSVAGAWATNDIEYALPFEDLEDWLATADKWLEEMGNPHQSDGCN